MAELLRAEDGAIIRGLIQQTDRGPQASYSVELHAGSHVDHQTDLRLFETNSDAEDWLRAEALRRGFKSIPIDRE